MLFLNDQEDLMIGLSYMLLKWSSYPEGVRGANNDFKDFHKRRQEIGE